MPGAQNPGRDNRSNGVGAVVEAVDEIEDQRHRDDHDYIQDGVVHAQACLMEIDSRTFPASSM